jgi:decaprenylphospho-beta-D-erythro-pentofuranosid-2-ulose 2-reductase
MIFGATSAIAAAAARILAERGADLFAVGRDPDRLAAVVSDLRVHGASLGSLVRRGVDALGGVDGVLIAQGMLGDQRDCERDPQKGLAVFQTNLVGPALLAQHSANVLAAQGRGVLVGISSVAGERGRQSNYFYGAAKAGFTTFLQGLRHRLHGSGVHVLTIVPGQVATPMTAAMPRTALFATPDSVARGIIRAADRRRRVAYLPAFWRYIMAVIRNLPEAIFLRTRL